MVKGMTIKKIIEALQQAGTNVFNLYDDPDKEITENQRDPNQDGSYAIAVKASVEADEENKNQSADQRKANNCQDITLKERIFLELVYFLATKKHLDEDNVTYCSGSRHRYGYVPNVAYLSGDRLVYVHWYYSDNYGDRLRARSVSVLPSNQAKLA